MAHPVWTVLAAVVAFAAVAQAGPDSAAAKPEASSAASTDGSEIFVQLGHAGPVQDLSLSDDGKWLAAEDMSGGVV